MSSFHSPLALHYLCKLIINTTSEFMNRNLLLLIVLFLTFSNGVRSQNISQVVSDSIFLHCSYVQPSHSTKPIKRSPSNNDIVVCYENGVLSMPYCPCPGIMTLMNLATGEVVLSQSVESGSVCLQLPILYCGCYKLSYYTQGYCYEGYWEI